MLPDWKYYELQIHQLLSFEYPKAIVFHDVQMKGKMSLRRRQLDVLLLNKRSNKNFGIAECKYLKNRKIDVTKIDAISEYIQQEVEYPSCYCKKCKRTNLYEVKIIRGFADFGNIVCPECGNALFETRLDGDYRVIKRFPGRKVSKDQISEAIVLHLVWTRMSWDRMFSLESILEDGMKVKFGENCFICRRYFDDSLPGSMKISYKRKQICVECFMSSRTLLIDCAIKAPSFEDFFSQFMLQEQNWKKFKTMLMAVDERFHS